MHVYCIMGSAGRKMWIFTVYKLVFWCIFYLCCKGGRGRNLSLFIGQSLYVYFCNCTFSFWQIARHTCSPHTLRLSLLTWSIRTRPFNCVKYSRKSLKTMWILTASAMSAFLPSVHFLKHSIQTECSGSSCTECPLSATQRGSRSKDSGRYRFKRHDVVAYVV